MSDQTVSPPPELTSLVAYIEHCVFLAGSNAALGARLGFSSGSRVGEWLKGDGRPSEASCWKLADLSGHDPLVILRLAGHDEMADLLEKRLRGTTHAIPLMKTKTIQDLEQAQRTMEWVLGVLKGEDR